MVKNHDSLNKNFVKLTMVQSQFSLILKLCWFIFFNLLFDKKFEKKNNLVYFLPKKN